MSRNFSIKEMIEYNSRIASDRTNDMEDWDRSFANSIAERYKKYGPATFLSDKQTKHILRIFTATGGHNAPAPEAQRDKYGFDKHDTVDPDDPLDPDDLPF